jgi:hypothetical protein
MHGELTARYVAGGLRRLDVLRSDMHALEGWRACAALLREHLLPPPSYILRRYGSRRAFLLPAFYVHRIACGAARWFRPLADSR